MLNRRNFIKTSTNVAVGTIIAPSYFMVDMFNKSKIGNIGLQLWSIAKNLEKDFEGTLQMLSKIGYKELELFGPYPFSTEKDKAAWKGITSQVGFSQSGYFNHSPKDFKKNLESKGLRTSAMHVGLDTLRNKLNETAEAAHLLGQQYAGIAYIPEDERRTLDDYKRMADEFNVIGEKAKALDLRFYYHNHGYGLKELEGKVPLDLILERTDPSLVYFEMDIFWTIAGGGDPIKFLDNNAGRFKLMHIKDMKKQVRFSGDGGNSQQWIELFPNITDAGSGVLDLTTILSYAKKSGVEHFIVENDVIVNVKDSLEKAYRYIASEVLRH
jgi:sugar phosphate isomerase/epimerase